MANTPTNVSGDTLAAVLVARSEGELDLAVYNSPTGAVTPVTAGG